MKNVLICGATGFIGRNLTLFYSKQNDYRIFATYHKKEPFECKNITWIKADLRDKDDVKKALEGIDILIQAAATTSGAKDIVNSPHIHVTDNAVMNSLIFREAFEQNLEQVLFFSCSVMYQSSQNLIKESDFNGEIPQSYFGAGWTKVYIEKQAEFYAKLNKTKFTVLRHSNIYGEYDKFDLEKSHVFGATMTKVLTNSDGEIVIWGDGEAKRDLLYVYDLIEAVDICIRNQKDNFELLNVGLEKAISIRELVSKIIKISKRDIKISFDKTKPNINTKIALDCSKIKSKFGWEAKTSLEEGIKKTMAWYRENIMIYHPINEVISSSTK